MRRVFVLATPLLALGLAACGVTQAGGGEEIAIVAGERPDGMYFEPDTVIVAAGQKVTFVITNEGQADHEFESIEEGEAGIEEVLVPAGKTRKVTWTAPAEPGAFPVYCDLPGHRAAGMELTLTVVVTGASPVGSPP